MKQPTRLRGIRARLLGLERNRMTRAEDFEFSVPMQGQENKWHFFGFAAALNVGRTEKIESPRNTNSLGRYEHYLRYELIYRFEHIVSYSSGKVVAKSVICSAQSRLNSAIK